MQNDRPFLFALAGLLHDIGKVAVRADVGASRTWDDSGRADYKYKHALLSADFVEEHVPAQWRAPVLTAVGRHHLPQTPDDLLVTLADWLSAGERADPADDEQRRTHPRQLESIFGQLTAAGITLTDAERRSAYLPLAPLAMRDDRLFPSSARPESGIWQDYERLWQELERDAARLHAAHQSAGYLPTYVAGLQLIMQRLLWSVPSAYYRNRPDISLFDHCRMTGALAALLAVESRSPEQLATLRAGLSESDEQIALLIGGDMSGVQDFIYTISAKGATPALRGRSFYLQLLTEAVVRFLLRRLDLPATNVVYSGGGRFYILAAPTHASRLPEMQRHLSRILLQHHRGDLHIAVVARPLTAREFFAGRLAHAWRDLQQQIERAKQRRFQELALPDWLQLFAPQAGGDEALVCQVCGREHPGTKVERKSADDEGVRKCPPCSSYEALGDSLRKARYLRLVEEESSPAQETLTDRSPGGYAEVLAALALTVASHDELRQLPGPQAGGVSLETIWALSDDALAGLEPGPRRVVGRRLLVNVTPTITQPEIDALKEDRGFHDDLPKAGSVKPFSVLSRQSQGISRLGVLRMDVDGLGKLFSEGLGERATLSRIASLSFAISLYFEGWVEMLAAERNAREGEQLYSIYSGGDDLFFVGSWEAVVELARDIRRDLTRYGAGHPGLTASAGLALVTDKYPLAQAAQDAGRAEKAAKHFQRWTPTDPGGEKDAVSFLGQTLPWEQFGLGECAPGLDSAHALMHYLTEERDRPPRTLIRRLIQFHAQYDEAVLARQAAGKDRTWEAVPQVVYGPWCYRAVYALSRFTATAEKDKGVELRDQLQRDSFRSMTWIGLAARWAELALRRRGAEL